MLQMADLIPFIVTVFSIAAAVAALRIFFTFWMPLDRLINGDRFTAKKAARLEEWKDRNVDIHLKSGAVLEKVILLGYPLTHPQSPLELRQMLAIKFREGHEGFVKMSEIEFIAENKW
jgi:hypothetical protein